MPDKKRYFRVLEAGEEIWQGSARDVNHVLKRCFYSETPFKGIVTVEEWAEKKLTREIKVHGWVERWRGHL